jgi:hypothetical protein
MEGQFYKAFTLVFAISVLGWLDGFDDGRK